MSTKLLKKEIDVQLHVCKQMMNDACESTHGILDDVM